MNLIANVVTKALAITAASMLASTAVVAVSSPALASSSTASAKPSQTKEVSYPIKRHYGPDNVMANQFHVLWQVVQTVDTRTGKITAAKSITRIYCQVFPSNLGWTGKGSCNLKKIPTGYIITHMAVFNSPRACVGNTCTPSITMTLGSRIYLDPKGTFLREEPIGDSA